MGYRRFYAELSSSFSGSDAQLSQSLFTQTFSGSGQSALTYTFQKNLQTIRVDITSSDPGKVNFLLTPSGSGPALVEKVVAWGEGAALSGAFAVQNNGEGKQITNGFWTGTIVDGDAGTYVTASLHPNIGNTIVSAGALCYVTSSRGPIGFQVFYRTQQ